MKLKLKKENEFEKAAMKVSAVSIAANVLLSAFKLLAGILASSGAMISDAIHSASDVISTVVVIIGIRLSGKASDKEHPYGHERMECVAAIILATILAFTGLGIGLWGTHSAGRARACGSSRVDCGEGGHVLVYQKLCKKDQFKCTDGGCVASSLGRALIRRRAGRYCGGKAWLSGL